MIRVSALMLTLVGATAWGEVSEPTLLDQAKKVCPKVVIDVQAAADAALERGPFTVMNKTEPPPSGDLHDFATLSPYFWPDPDSDDGLPFVFRDGQVNPDAKSEKYDRVRYFAMGDAVKACALGYQLFSDERYAAHAARLLRTWFLDPATRTNPNFNHAQQIPGKRDGSSTGIIRGILIVELISAVHAIEDSAAWTENDRVAWKDWLALYLNWLRESELGKRESRAFNNHGTWFDVQVVSLALECGKRQLAIDVLREVGPRRIARHIADDGRQPMELLRTKSWDYSVMNLQGLFTLAELGATVDVDLWEWTSEDGRSIRRALDFLVPFAKGNTAWRARQIRPLDGGKLYPLLCQAAEVYESQAYSDAASQLQGFDPSLSMLTLQELLRTSAR